MEESSKLLAQLLPQLSEHFLLNDIMMEQVFQSNFLSLFVSCLPFQAILELWDDMICCSGSRLLVPLAVAWLERHQALLLRSSGPEILKTLRSLRSCEQKAMGMRLRRRSHEIWEKSA